MKKILPLFFLAIVLTLSITKVLTSDSVDVRYILEDTTENYVTVYYVNERRLYGVKMKRDSDNNYELLEEVINYLTINSNYAPPNYYSALANSMRLIDYKIKDKEITMNFNSDFYLYKANHEAFVLAALYETLFEIGYETIYIEVNGEQVNQLGNYLLNGDYAYLVNLTVEDTVDVEVIKIYRYLDDCMTTFDIYFTNTNDKIEEIIIRTISNPKMPCDFDNNELVSYEEKGNVLNIYFSKQISGYDLLYQSLKRNLSDYKIALKLI